MRSIRLQDISTYFDGNDVGVYVIQTKNSELANSVFEILSGLKFDDKSYQNVAANWYGGLAKEKFKTIHVSPKSKVFRRKIMNRTYADLTERDFPIPLYDDKFFIHWDFKFVMIEKI